MGVFDKSHILYLIACFNHSNEKDLCLIVHYILLYLNNAISRYYVVIFIGILKIMNDLI